MAVTVSVYYQGKEDILSSTVDLDGDTIKVGLLNSSGTFTATHTQWSDVSANEISGGTGYTAGGQALANKAVTHSSGTSKFDADDSVWTASGGSIGAADNAAAYSTTVSNRLLFHVAFGGSNTAGDGTQFKIVYHASGILNLS